MYFCVFLSPELLLLSVQKCPTQGNKITLITVCHPVKVMENWDTARHSHTLIFGFLLC